MKTFVAALTLRFQDRFSGSTPRAVAAMGQLKRAQEMGAAASKQWSRGLEELDGKLNRLAAASLVTDGLGRAGEAMMRPLRAGVALATTYEEKLAEIGDTADMTAARIARMDRAIMAASRLGRGPTKVADAAGIFVAGGLSDETAAGLLTTTTKVVIGARVAFDDAASAAMAFNQNMKVTTGEIERAFDAAAYAGKQGKFELRDMAQYLPSIGAAAARRGLTGVRGVAEITAALTAIRNQVGESSEAATYMRDLLMKLDSNETANNFAKFNIDVRARLRQEEARGRSPLDAIMDITEEARSRGAQVNQLFTDAQAQLGLQALLDQRDAFNDIRSSAEQAAGVVETSYRRMRATGVERQAGYAAAIERMGIAAGTILAPAVGLAADALGKIADWMSRAGENGSLLAKVAVWAAAGFAGFAVAAGAVGHAVVGVLGPMLIMRTLFGTMGGAMLKSMAANVIGAFARMRLAALSFNLTMLANPVVLGIAAAVAAVAVAAVVIRKYWQPISAFFTGVGQVLGEAFGPSLAAIGAALAPLKPLWDGVTGAIGDFFGWLSRLTQPMQATKGQMEGATEAGRRFGRMLVLAFNVSPVGLLVSGVRLGFAAVRAVMAWRPMETLRAAWSGVSGFFGGLAARFAGYGRAIIQGLINGVRAMLGAVAGAVTGVASGAVTRFKAVLGIRSPSRVFAGLGGFMTAGLAQGLDRGGRAAVARVAALGAAMTAALTTPDWGLPAWAAEIGTLAPPAPTAGPGRADASAEAAAPADPASAAPTDPASPAPVVTVIGASPDQPPPPQPPRPLAPPAPPPGAGASSIDLSAFFRPPPTVPAAPAPAAPAASTGRGLVIERLEIAVTVQGGGRDARSLGREIGRETADAFRRRLFDGLE